MKKFRAYYILLYSCLWLAGTIIIPLACANSFFNKSTADVIKPVAHDIAQNLWASLIWVLVLGIPGIILSLYTLSKRFKRYIWRRFPSINTRNYSTSGDNVKEPEVATILKKVGFSSESVTMNTIIKELSVTASITKIYNGPDCRYVFNPSLFFERNSTSLVKRKIASEIYQTYNSLRVDKIIILYKRLFFMPDILSDIIDNCTQNTAHVIESVFHTPEEIRTLPDLEFDEGGHKNVLIIQPFATENVSLNELAARLAQTANTIIGVVTIFEDRSMRQARPSLPVQEKVLVELDLLNRA